MKKCQPNITYALLCYSQTACEKTVSAMSHVITRTITYANGKLVCFFLSMFVFVKWFTVSDINTMNGKMSAITFTFSNGH